MRWFIFFQDRLLLRKEEKEKYSVPDGTKPPFPPKPEQNIHTITLTDGEQAKAFFIEQPVPECDKWMMSGLRATYELISWAEYRAAGKAYQILYWDKQSRFCPACGSPTEQRLPIMKKCPCCGNELYPPISTATIVLIRRGKEILLVHARNFRGTFYGLVAGFLEVGETLEECVQREVMEETGLRIKNIRYFGSQSWPYPSGLMVGFVADYESGEIKLQEEELTAGAFYSKENLPEIPSRPSIARALIEWWLKQD